MGMREYETIFILRADLTEEAQDVITSKFEKIVKEHDGHVLTRETWGKKKLAYDIAKQSKGIYFLYQFLGDGTLVDEIERNFKIDESVLRYMTIKLDDDVEPESRLEAFDKPDGEPESEGSESAPAEDADQARSAAKPGAAPDSGDDS